MSQVPTHRDCGAFPYLGTCSALTNIVVNSGLQSRSLLEELLAGVTKARDDVVSSAASRKPKIVLKIAPDLTEQDIHDIAEVVKTSAVDGVIVSNTTISRPPSLTDRESLGHYKSPSTMLNSEH